MASKKRSRKHRHRSRKMRGGYQFSPASLNDSYMIKDVVPQEFTPQDRALVGGRRMKKAMNKSMRRSMNKSMKRSMNKSMGMGMMGGRFRKRKGGLGESGESAASAV